LNALPVLELTCPRGGLPRIAGCALAVVAFTLVVAAFTLAVAAFTMAFGMLAFVVATADDG
jgi:hypothetical protein